MKKIKIFKIILGGITVFGILFTNLYAQDSTDNITSNISGFNPGSFPGRTQVISTNDRNRLISIIDSFSIETRNNFLERILSRVDGLQTRLLSTETDSDTLLRKINFLWDIRNIIQQKEEELENIVGAPMFTLSSNLVSGTTASVSVNINKPGIGYYVVIPGSTGSTVTPSIRQINAGQNNLGSPSMSGNMVLTGGTNIINISGLSTNTSYIMYFTAKDFAGNQLNVGSISLLTNSNTSPVFPTNLQISSITNSSAQASINLTGRTGSGYYVILPTGSLPPNVSQIRNGQNTFGVSTMSGSWNVVSGNNQFNLTGLNPNTSYTIYYIIPDNFGNYQSIGNTTFQTSSDGAISLLSVTSVSNTSVTVGINMTGSTIGYYVVLPSGSVMPTSSQIMNLQNSSGTTVLPSGIINLTTGSNTLNISGLIPNTSYILYFVTQDNQTPLSLAFTTPS